MITGAHLLIYSQNAEADRAFIQNVLRFPSVDAGGGWLIYKLPVAEAAVHPATDPDGMPRSELYFMCDDLAAEIAALASQNVRCSEVKEERWGHVTSISLPSGGRIGLYQPLHPTALKL